ncbi:MAG TPA: tetratricopeptide repeat protein [Devosiaceae bacterium]|nr:tetratricopeptide repeat protein [Devosiaceae bacterium]
MTTSPQPPEAASVEPLIVLGRSLLEQGQFENADLAFRLALTAAPERFEAHMGLGTALEQLGDHKSAVESFTAAVRVRPEAAAAHNNLAIALYGCLRLEECIAAYQAALALRPDLAAIHHNLGEVLRDVGRTADAAAAFEAALRLEPGYLDSAVQLAHARRLLCDWGQYEADWQLLQQLVANNVPLPPFSLLAWPSTPAEQLSAARTWAARLSVPADRLAPGRPNASGKIRLGYISADFRAHATGQLIGEVIERHDRSRFEVVCYSYGPNDGSPERRRIEAAADVFIDISARSHLEAAQRIAGDGIDILLDLQGNTSGARTEIFACRPAPVQVNYLAYPATMGSGHYDYIIADPVLIPASEQRWFAENLVHLPNCYQPNDPNRRIEAPLHSRADYGLPEGAFVFCGFHNSFKITPAVFDVWMRLLHGVPNSVLWLLETGAEVRQNLLLEAARRGIAGERLVFAKRVGPDEHLARQRHADLFLDAFPYGAHTTGTDALLVGLPIVALAGKTFTSRVAASLLASARLPELVTATVGEYEALALELARSPEKLEALRAKLSRPRAELPLFDMKRYIAGLELAFAEMHRRARAGAAPAPITVAALKPGMMSAA